MAYEKQPTKDDVINRLEAALQGDISREAFNVWAYKWVQNFDCRNHMSAEENTLHQYLIHLLAIDLEIEQGVYLHDFTDIRGWIDKIKNNQALSS